MDCIECQKNLEFYLEGKLSSDEKEQIKKHLGHCSECIKIYSFLAITERVIHEEKELLSNPYIATRVMAEINQLENQKEPIFRRTLQPILVAASITIAVIFGVLAGSLYNQDKNKNMIPEELVYINDAGLESLAIYENQ